MLITVSIIVIILAALIGWFNYCNYRHPYIQPTRTKSLRDQLTLQHHARIALTTAASKRRPLYWLAQGSWIVGVLCWLISAVLVETKLPLLIFPTNAAIASAVLMVVGAVLVMVTPLIWSGQAFNYWADHADQTDPSFSISDGQTFKRYRRRQIWSTLLLDLLVILVWVARAISISTVPVLVVEYLLISIIIAIPIVALLTLLGQLPYLHLNRYLIAEPGKVPFGRLHWRAGQAVIAAQPARKRRLLIVHVSRIIGYLFGLAAFWVLYSNIIAPAFSVDPTAVFPAAMLALVALLILETIGVLWAPKLYEDLTSLDTTQQPFQVAGRDRFDQFHYHLSYFHLSAGIVWVVIWLTIIGAYYYYG